MAPEGPTGGPRGAPRPPRQSRGTIKADRNGQFSGNVQKHKKEITKNMTMPMGHYASKTSEILTI